MYSIAVRAARLSSDSRTSKSTATMSTFTYVSLFLPGSLVPISFGSPLIFLFFFKGSGAHRDLPSSPTRRSPDPERRGREAGWLYLAGVQAHMKTALEPFHFPKPIISEISATDVYFAPGVYDKLKSDPAALDAVLKAIEAVPGVFAVYRGEELEDSPATRSPLRTAQANSFFPARSGDLLLVPKPYWPWDSSAPGAIRTYGTTHGSPYAYDQRVPVLFMGYGIQPGEYFESATPADIAPTLAALCGVTLAPLEGHILYEALKKREPAAKSSKAARASSTPH